MDSITPKLPQPIDYSLTYGEVCNWRHTRGDQFRDEMPENWNCKFTYKQGEWVPFWNARAVPLWLTLYTVGFAVYAALNSIPGGWAWDNPGSYIVFFAAMVFPGAILLGIVIALDHGIREGYARREPPSESLLEFRSALSEYKSALVAVRRKYAYWESLDGRQFEIATAKVLGLHRFNPWLTGGPGDGGIDIEVDRDGVRGVVQCKAHAAPIGPHAIRDLFGVIHDSRAGFGIVASRTGFTVGAVEFAKGKPIFLIDVTELVAMAEGIDVFDSILPRPNTDLKPMPTDP